MDGEVENKCPSCDKPLKEGASFCTNCGAAVGAPAGAAAAAPPAESTQPLPPPQAAAAPPVPPADAAPPAPPGVEGAGAGIVAAGAVPPTPPRKNKAALLVGVIGGILVVAGIVVLVLWLAVWRDGGGGGGTSDPIALAEKFLSAMEKGDVDAYLDCFEPGYLEDNDILESMGMDMKELLEMTFDMAEIELGSYALELESEKGSEAVVVTTEGTLTISVMGFDQEYDLADDPMEFVMVKEGGRWYLTQDPMPGMGTEMDFDDLEFDDESMEDLDLEDMDLEDLNMDDLNLEDLEEMLPEGMSLEDMENMTPDDLEKLMEELERLMEESGAGISS